MSIEMLENAQEQAKVATGLRPDRRQFIASTAGGFMLQFCMPGLSRIAEAAGTVAPTQVNSYIQIGTDNTITVLFGGCELGQGAMSGFAQIVAEDLMVDWSHVKVQTAPPGAISYITGGSSAIKDNYLILRQAGAAARMMLIQAAATIWHAPVTDCYAKSATVFHRPTGRSYSYALLAPAAAKLVPPTNPTLIPDAQLRLIGKPILRQDISDKTNGRAIFGLDVRLPGMLYAVVENAPVLGATMTSPPSNPGAPIVAVVPLGPPGAYTAVAYAAGNTWDAWQGGGGGGGGARVAGGPRALAGPAGSSGQWNIPASAATLSSSVFAAQAAAILAIPNSAVSKGQVLDAEVVGNVVTGLARSTKLLDATYSFPYLAHACMEVLNCTVSITETGPIRCEIWAPTQVAGWVQATASALTGLPMNKILVHTTLLGGGLGRKLELDYITQAVQVGMAVKKPVKLMWPREQDMANDKYRPMAVSYVKAGLDVNNNIVAWHNRIVTPSILAQKGFVSAGSEDGQATEGATGLPNNQGVPYAMGNRLVEFGIHPSPVPIGFWRSVGNSYNIFVLESFIDELAHLVNVDPYLYRRKLLASNPRFLAVLDAAAKLGNWTAAPPSGHFRGIAIGIAFGTVVAEVVEITNATATSVNVVSVACAVDLGRAINPDSVVAQMEGGIVHGLTSVQWGNVTWAAGVPSARNFSNNRVMTAREMPQINVTIVPSTNPPTGAGEPAVPPLGPALANAYFKATGTRVRNLPFFPTQNHMND